MWPFKKAKKGSFTSMLHSVGNFFTSWAVRGSKFNYTRAVGDGSDASVLMAPIMWVARAATQARFRITDNSGDEPEHLTDHPLTKLLKNPNPWYTGKDLQQATIVSLLAAVDAYWIKIKLNGVPEELWYVPSSMIRPVTLPHNQGKSKRLS